MVRFAHLADCHLGSWKQPELQHLNIESFRQAIDICINEKVNFIIIAGDLFDSAYPPIEILKETFNIMSKVKDAKIPCYIIAGSHDYSVSGKTFLDVLEKAGFCINVHQQEDIENSEKTFLVPTLHNNIALYGYPGRKSGLEVPQVRNIKLQNSDSHKILVLHTTMDFVKGDLPIDSVDEDILPKSDYCALGHIHVVRSKAQYHYPGPIFPNNFSELAELHYGGFYIVDIENNWHKKRYDLPLKKVVYLEIEIKNSLTANEKIISELSKHDIDNKIVLLKLKGILDEGKVSDVRFKEIQDFIEEKNAYCFLKSTSALKVKQSDDLKDLSIDSEKVDVIEDHIIDSYIKNSSSDFGQLVTMLIPALSIEKNEDEKSVIFENRLMEEARKVLGI
jgi:hypothetical protein